MLDLAIDNGRLGCLRGSACCFVIVVSWLVGLVAGVWWWVWWRLSVVGVRIGNLCVVRDACFLPFFVPFCYFAGPLVMKMHEMRPLVRFDKCVL
jgi:hypothetical protein